MKKTILNILIAITLTSCTSMYYPSLQNIPMFEQKGEVITTISANNYQFGYSFSNSLGMVANGFYTNPLMHLSVSDDWSLTSMHRYGIDGGICYFKKINKSISTEVIAGAGIGHSYYAFHSSGYDYTVYKGDMNQSSYLSRYYIQPDISFLKHIILSTRFSYVDFFNTIENHPNYNTSNVKQTFIFEPALSSRFGKNGFYVKSQFQYSLPFKTDINTDLKFWDWRYFNTHYIFSLAFEMHFDEIFKKKESSSISN